MMGPVARIAPSTAAQKQPIDRQAVPPLATDVKRYQQQLTLQQPKGKKPSGQHSGR